MTALPSHQGGTTEGRPDPGGLQVGHLYFDVNRRRLHLLNEAARQIHGQGVPFSPADMAGQRLLHPDGKPARHDELPLVVAWKEQRPVEAGFLLPRAHGPAWCVNWTVTLLREEQGKLAALLATVTYGPPEPDWRLMAELAHDLRNPLHAIGMLSAILEARPPNDPGHREALQRIQGAVNRAMDIGRDLLEWCRYPLLRGRPVKPRWFALEPFLTALADEQTPEAQRKSLQLHLDVSAARGWEVHTDRVRLGRLLANLLSNAVRYTPRGRVEFAASWRPEAEGGFLAVSVLDTGMGMKSEEQESVFEPFERGKAGKDSDSGGSGLGLASVDNLVKELGLTLEVYSEFNRGSAFHLLLAPAILRQAAGTGSNPDIVT